MTSNDDHNLKMALAVIYLRDRVPGGTRLGDLHRLVHAFLVRAAEEQPGVYRAVAVDDRGAERMVVRASGEFDPARVAEALREALPDVLKETPRFPRIVVEAEPDPWAPYRTREGFMLELMAGLVELWDGESSAHAETARVMERLGDPRAPEYSLRAELHRRGARKIEAVVQEWESGAGDDGDPAAGPALDQVENDTRH